MHLRFWLGQALSNLINSGVEFDFRVEVALSPGAGSDMSRSPFWKKIFYVSISAQFLSMWYLKELRRCSKFESARRSHTFSLLYPPSKKKGNLECKRKLLSAHFIGFWSLKNTTEKNAFLLWLDLKCHETTQQVALSQL